MRLLIGSDVTSRYTRRNAVEYHNIASYIHSVVSSRKGNYMVFCPSHQFLTEVYDAYLTYFYDEKNVECLVQTEYMDETARENFLSRFKGQESAQWDLTGKICMEIEQEDKTLLGFCVLGGLFSEGIDLKGEALIGAIVVGTGLLQVCREREILMEYFDERGDNGFDYAYRYPGMNKVLQAAGRVIRTAQDRGIVALLDERFELPVYQKMFPREWEHFTVVSQKECQSAVQEFWSKNDISSL